MRSTLFFELMLGEPTATAEDLDFILLSLPDKERSFTYPIVLFLAEPCLVTKEKLMHVRCRSSSRIGFARYGIRM